MTDQRTTEEAASARLLRRALGGGAAPDPPFETGARNATRENNMKMQYKIEKGVPLLGACKYPLEQMEVGNSFFVPSAPGGKTIELMGHRVSSTVTSARAKRYGRKYKTRTVKAPPGVRVWRVK